MENLVGIGVADAAEQMRIRERPLEGVVLRSQNGFKLLERRRQRFEPARILQAESFLSAKHVQRSPALGAGFREHQAPFREIERRQRNLAAELGTAGFQASRPAIIRCRTIHRSSSSPIAMRFPTRRISRTFFPKTASIGGSKVRNKNAALIRTRSSSSPTIRRSSAST